MNVYDFDGTIYNGDSSIDFYFYSLRRNPRVILYLPKQLFAFILYFLKIIDKTRVKEEFFSFVKLIDIEEFVSGFWNRNRRKIFTWYLEQKTNKDVIISASPEFLLKSICETMGVNCLIASKVSSINGKFSGKNCSGEEKVNRFKEIFGDSIIDSFYSNSEKDLPLARLSKRPYKVIRGKVKKWYI